MPIRKYREKVLPTWDKRHKKLWLLPSILPMILAKYVDKKKHPLGVAFSEKIYTESVMYLKTARNEHLSLFKN